MNLVDVLILGVILLGAMHGYQRGLITSIVNLASSLVGYIVAARLYMAALLWTEQYLPLQKWVEPIVYRAILPSVQSKTLSLQEQALGNILGALPPEWRSLFQNSSSVNMPQTIEQVTHRLAGILTERILSLIAFGVVFYIVVILIQFFVGMFLRPFGIWGGTINRGGGLIFGGLSALIGLSILGGLLSPLLKLGGGGSFYVLLQTSKFYPYLVEIFQGLDQIFSAQLSQKLLEPLSQLKGVWF